MNTSKQNKRIYGEEGTSSFEVNRPFVIICEGQDDKTFSYAK